MQCDSPISILKKSATFMTGRKLSPPLPFPPPADAHPVVLGAIWNNFIGTRSLLLIGMTSSAYIADGRLFDT